MPSPVARLASRPWLLLALVLGLASLALAQFGGGQGGGAIGPALRPRMEYHSEEVQADLVVETLNNLDKDGWDLFQVVPVWKLQNNGQNDTTLMPQRYQVFGRRPTRAAK